MTDTYTGAVKRAIKLIKKTDDAFAEHLTQSIQFGYDPIYKPSEPIQWETDHMVNQ